MKNWWANKKKPETSRAKTNLATKEQEAAKLNHLYLASSALGALQLIIIES